MKEAIENRKLALLETLVKDVHTLRTITVVCFVASIVIILLGLIGSYGMK